MTCFEFQEVLPDVIDGVRSVDHEAHLKSCSECLVLVADLEVILREARQLEGMFEPSPRVWNSIEATLRQEGIIQDARRSPELVKSVRRPWRFTWMMAPVAAILLIAFLFFYRQQQAPMQTADLNRSASLEEPSHYPPVVDDSGFLQTVSFPTPAVRASYEANMRDVDAYIRDAEASAKMDPNDEEAQQLLMNAYEQRSMVYEMALDRSLP